MVVDGGTSPSNRCFIVPQFRSGIVILKAVHIFAAKEPLRCSMGTLNATTNWLREVCADHCKLCRCGVPLILRANELQEQERDYTMSQHARHTRDRAPGHEKRINCTPARIGLLHTSKLTSRLQTRWQLHDQRVIFSTRISNTYKYASALRIDTVMYRSRYYYRAQIILITYSVIDLDLLELYLEVYLLLSTLRILTQLISGAHEATRTVCWDVHGTALIA